MTKTTIGIGMLLVACAAFTMAQTQPASMPSAETTDTALATAHWQVITTQLSNADFAIREAGQRELDKATWRDREDLQRMADSATDEEVKARLKSRVVAIDDQLLLDPPPISIEVKDAKLREVAAALGKATGANVHVDPLQNRQTTWTLSQVEAPFWQVVEALSAQHPLDFIGPSGADLVQATRGLKNLTLYGGFALFSEPITRDAQAPVPTLRLSLRLLADPRITVTQYKRPLIDSVIDDRGQNLYRPAAAMPGMADQWQGAMMPNQMQFGCGAKLDVPGADAKSVSVKGSFRLGVARTISRLEFDDIEHKAGKVLGGLHLGNFTVTGNRFTIQGNNVLNGPGTFVTLVDGNGDLLWRVTITNTFTGSGMKTGGGAIVSPVKMIVTAPGKVKEVTIPFEIKSLPLP